MQPYDDEWCALVFRSLTFYLLTNSLIFLAFLFSPVVTETTTHFFGWYAWKSDLPEVKVSFEKYWGRFCIGTSEHKCTVDQIKLSLAASPIAPEAERVVY